MGQHLPGREGCAGEGTDSGMSTTTPEVRDNVIAWRPGTRELERSRLRRFMAASGNETLDDHLQWAAQDAGRYWDAVVRDLGLHWHRPYDQALDLSNGAPWPEWFVNGG